MRALALFALAAAAPLDAARDREDDGAEFFEKKIRPVLVERCYKCHSLGAEKVKGGLLLDSREALLKGGLSGPAIVPGNPERSLLIKAIRYGEEDLQMPPKGQMLAAHEIADFEGWVRNGAPASADWAHASAGKPAPTASKIDPAEARKYWAFRPLSAAPLAIDAWVDRKLEERGLTPAPRADRRSLIRRATLDLTGLPPTPDEVEAFVKDEAPDAFARLVDRLLASPAYGERWGRHWLDVVRYADTAGDSSDFPVPQAVLYRDYVIRSFNEDTPFDRFLLEQIAGDLIPGAADVEKVATGYLALARRFGIKPESHHHLTIEDTVDNLGRTFLGLGLSCARCHDHKFDPIPTEDYYALYGIFQSTRYPYPGSETTKYQKDFVPLAPPDEVERLLRPHLDKLAALETTIAKLQEEKKPDKEAKKERDRHAMQPPPVPTAYAVSEGAPGNARLHVRGDPHKPGPEVPRGFLQALGGQTLSSGGSGRRELAGWMTAHPLVARVMVNRIWHWHFGRGIVATPSDFGRQGRPPTHPELLDGLAARFVEGGWSVKAMHRLIMLSSAYRRAGTGDPKNLAADPENAYLWKFRARRLEAEAIRDSMLFVSGELDRSAGGPHPFPPPSKWDYSQAKPFTANYADYDHKRRGVYLMTQRLRKRSLMEIFDGPDPNATTPARTASTTPLQALFSLNDGFVHERAAQFAARLAAARAREGPRVELAYQLALGRPPTAEEAAGAIEYLSRFRAKAPGEAAWTSLARVLLGSNEFLFIP